ncbi:MAG: HD domain-containing protein [Christensenellaceae bacterium]
MKYTRYDKEIYDTLYRDLKDAQDALGTYATKDSHALRRQKETFVVSRPNFIKDIERVINCRYFNRYADKTQVFSLYKNDDISRRILHVQIVSRIARNIGRMLKLNLDLIEAIALGHDLGHTPFGHAGERFLSEIYHQNTGRYFNHNVHSVRILDKILRLNLSLQTLDGILCHNGEKVIGEYTPYIYEDGAFGFESFDVRMEQCYTHEHIIGELVPATLEGCVVRLCDVIAYLGKDRQDAAILGIQQPFEDNEVIGSTNSEFISNIIVNIVSNSYGKNYLLLDEEYAQALDHEKKVNYTTIYEPQDSNDTHEIIHQMFCDTYAKLLDDLLNKDENSPIFRHHINHIFKGFYNAEERLSSYLKEESNQIVVDYIASMTDDYFMDLHEYLFPGSKKIKYKSYFSHR